MDPCLEKKLDLDPFQEKVGSGSLQGTDFDPDSCSDLIPVRKKLDQDPFQ